MDKFKSSPARSTAPTEEYAVLEANLARARLAVRQSPVRATRVQFMLGALFLYLWVLCARLTGSVPFSMIDVVFHLSFGTALALIYMDSVPCFRAYEQKRQEMLEAELELQRFTRTHRREVTYVYRQCPADTAPTPTQIHEKIRVRIDGACAGLVIYFGILFIMLAVPVVSMLIRGVYVSPIRNPYFILPMVVVCFIIAGVNVLIDQKNKLRRFEREFVQEKIVTWVPAARA
jgi:hypothetical protein